MPGHVHTLGILKHSRSRHDRNNRGGIEDDDCLLGDNEELSYNPTGDPLLDAKMMQVVMMFFARVEMFVFVFRSVRSWEGKEGYMNSARTSMLVS